MIRKNFVLRGSLATQETSSVIEALSSYGADVRFVGGCVRDTFAQRQITDIDLGTPDTPETIIKLLKENDFKAIPTGLGHGTVTAIKNAKTFQITTLRSDVKTDGRRAEVCFSKDWLKDAKRRDFTINALSAKPNGRIFDPFNGITDLKQGRVRFVGSPKKRINEDYLRILRYYRFKGIFSQTAEDNEADVACRHAAPSLKKLSPERITNELIKILKTNNSANTFEQMQKNAILKIVLPQAKNIQLLKILNNLQSKLEKSIY